MHNSQIVKTPKISKQFRMSLSIRVRVNLGGGRVRVQYSLPWPPTSLKERGPDLSDGHPAVI